MNKQVDALLAAEPVESAVVFGSPCQLTGVYTVASTIGGARAQTAKPFDKPCVLFLTAGLLHHVGPTRLHVELARHLARQGMSGLRFDLSGAGDSETSSDGGYFLERSCTEIRQAMDYLQSNYGHQRFVLLGLCSGADDALATAQLDSRVAGIVLLNGYAYPAGWFGLHRLFKFYLPRLLMWRKLCNRARLTVGRFTGKRVPTRNDNGISTTERLELQKLDDDYRYIPPQRSTEEQLNSLCRRGTELLFIYTGSEHECYTYEGQLFAMFPSLRNQYGVSERYLQEADHTFILKKDRQRVIGLIGQWFAQAEFARQKP